MLVLHLLDLDGLLRLERVELGLKFLQVVHLCIFRPGKFGLMHVFELVELVLMLFLRHVQLALQLCSDDLNVRLMLLGKLLELRLVPLTLCMQIEVSPCFLQRQLLLLQVLDLLVQGAERAFRLVSLRYDLARLLVRIVASWLLRGRN